MKNPKTHPAKRGLALVVVVSLMALLTVMILGLLMLSSNNRATANNDVSARQADNIAQAAVNTVIADVLQEMKNGATATTTTPDNKTLFAVDNPKSMVPERSLKSTVKSADYPTLIKQSADGVAFSSASQMPSPTAVPSRASSVSTLTPSVGGRFVASTSWADPKFFPPNADLVTNPVDPDWIYVTRNGSNPTTFAATNKDSTGTNGNYVIGRYAYQVYDTSGLIDINVAGNFDDPTPPAIERKDSLASIDISRAPLGINRINLTSWRRKASSLLPFNAFVQKWGRERGWQELALDSAETSSDNAFLSRRDLLDYQEANSGIIPPAALQHITTSSLALNRPSWSPQSNGSGASFQYLTDRDASTTINPRVEGVRVTTEFTRRDGTIAKVGEPLMKTRFPLSKLRAFAGGNTTSPDYNAADISSYFGLVPETYAGNQVISWSRNGTSVGQAIYIRTLSEVAAVNREPDFFEVLKAALLSGSLGSTMIDGWHFTTNDTLTELHILKIGANIIDQYDTDDYPTTIHNGLLAPHVGKSIQDAVGIENLPYFQTLCYTAFRRRDLDGEPPNDSRVSCYQNFQIWNPHSNAAAKAGSKIRIGMEGSMIATFRNMISPRRSGSSATDYIEFNHEAFASPTLIRPGVANAVAHPDDSVILSSGGLVTGGILGFNAGTVVGGLPFMFHAPYATEPGATPKEKCDKKWGLPRPPTTEVVYKMGRSGAGLAHVIQTNVNGTWIPYQYLHSNFQGAAKILIYECTDDFFNTNGLSSNTRAVLPDPRTNRNGTFFTQWGVKMAGASPGTRGSTLGGLDSFTDSFGLAGKVVERFLDSGWKANIPVITDPFYPVWLTHNSSTSPVVVIDRDSGRRPTDYTSGNGQSPYSNPARRPVMLNHPFTSVADIGYAFRDEPWRSINLFGDPETPTYQGDAALLDYFSLTESPIVSGTINLNSASQNIISLLLTNTSIRGNATISSTTANGYADTIKNQISSNPLLNTADLAKASSLVSPTTSDANEYEVISRGLSDVSDTRTWSLFIDVTAQSGNLPKNVSSAGLNQFIEKGQTRHWYHVNIDRFTGEVISMKREN